MPIRLAQVHMILWYCAFARFYRSPWKSVTAILTGGEGKLTNAGSFFQMLTCINRIGMERSIQALERRLSGIIKYVFLNINTFANFDLSSKQPFSFYVNQPLTGWKTCQNGLIFILAKVLKYLRWLLWKIEVDPNAQHYIKSAPHLSSWHILPSHGINFDYFTCFQIFRYLYFYSCG